MSPGSQARLNHGFGCVDKRAGAMQHDRYLLEGLIYRVRIAQIENPVFNPQFSRQFFKF
jgi:hypothetical protein